MKNKLIALNLLNDKINLELFYDVAFSDKIRLQGFASQINPLELSKTLNAPFVFDTNHGWLQLKTEFEEVTLQITLTF